MSVSDSPTFLNNISSQYHFKDAVARSHALVLLFGVNTDQAPFVVHECESLVFVHKPHNMHTAPLSAESVGTLLEWVVERFPEIRSVTGIKSVEPGLLHRLDHGTAGIVVFARTPAAFDRVKAAGENGAFLKEYRAICERSHEPVPGTRGEIPIDGREGSSGEKSDALHLGEDGLAPPPFTVSSRFRAYGPGGRRVAPVGLDAPIRRGTTRTVYRTDIIDIERVPPTVSHGNTAKPRETFVFRCKLARGFRHQVRVHLAALGFPIVGDQLYGAAVGETSPLRLYAVAVTLPDPTTGTTIRIECETDRTETR